jgi:hypothetical protein
VAEGDGGVSRAAPGQIVACSAIVKSARPPVKLNLGRGEVMSTAHLTKSLTLA